MSVYPELATVIMVLLAVAVTARRIGRGRSCSDKAMGDGGSNPNNRLAGIEFHSYPEELGNRFARNHSSG
jgi:hypothetical protein